MVACRWLSDVAPWLCRGGFLCQHIEKIAWIGTIAIIGIGIGIDDNAVAIDDVSGRDRQRPFARRSIAGGNIQVEALIRSLELITEFIDQAKRPPDFLADVAEDFEGKRVFLRGRKRIIRLLGTDRNQRSARGGNVWQNFLISFELEIAVGTPAAAIK